MQKRIIPEPFLSHSRSLRQHQTPWEDRLWRYLRAGRFYGLKFKRQVYIGFYIFDFSCRDKMLLIELDGGQHSEVGISQKDKEKQQFAERQGYTVLHFWNSDIGNNLPGVLEAIRKACRV